MRQNRHWGRRLAALALTAALTGSAAPALAAGDYWDVDRLDWYYDRWIDNGAEAWYREATAYALDNSLILPFGRSFEGGEVLNRGQFVAILSRLEGIDRDAVEQTGQFTDVTAADYPQSTGPVPAAWWRAPPPLPFTRRVPSPGSRWPPCWRAIWRKRASFCPTTPVPRRAFRTLLPSADGRRRAWRRCGGAA